MFRLKIQFQNSLVIYYEIVKKYPLTLRIQNTFAESAKVQVKNTKQKNQEFVLN